MVMRSLLTLAVGVALLLATAGAATAQRFAYLDSQYILEQLPDYKSVQQELDQISKQWQQEIEAKQKAIRTKFEDYQARRPLLSQEEQRRIQQEIETLERELAELRSKRFGYDGELFKLREEKMRPIQQRLLTAVQEVAKEKRADLVLDRASTGAVILYSNEAYDISNDVLRKLGITPTGTPPNRNAPGLGTTPAPGGTAPAGGR
jgi:outer membrane protein